MGEDDGAGIEPDANRKREAVGRVDLTGVGDDRITGVHGGADRAFGVVLVRDGRAEECEEAIPHHLGDRPLVAGDGGDYAAEHLVHDDLEPLGAQALAERRRAGDVTDHGGDDPPLARAARREDPLRDLPGNERAERLEPLRRDRKPRPAPVAELSRLVGRAAGRTGHAPGLSAGEQARGG